MGVVGVGVATDPSLGLSQLQHARHRVLVVAPGDPGRRATDVHPPLPEALILLHPAYRYGEDAVPIQRSALPGFSMGCPGELAAPPSCEDVLAEDDGFRDPVDRDDRRWLAGFAPVGSTGFVVAVLQDEEGDAAIGP